MDGRMGEKECRSCNETRPYSDFYSVKYMTCRFCILKRRGLARQNLKDETLSHYSDTDCPSCSCCHEKIIEFLS